MSTWSYCQAFYSFEVPILFLKQKTLKSYKSKVSKVGDRSRGRPESSFSIATTPKCRGEHYFFPRIVPLYPWYIPYIVVLSKEVSSTIFKVFGMMWPGIEPKSPGPLANTLPIRPMSWKSYRYYHLFINYILSLV